MKKIPKLTKQQYKAELDRTLSPPDDLIKRTAQQMKQYQPSQSEAIELSVVEASTSLLPLILVSLALLVGISYLLMGLNRSQPIEEEDGIDQQQQEEREIETSYVEETLPEEGTTAEVDEFTTPATDQPENPDGEEVGSPAPLPPPEEQGRRYRLIIGPALRNTNEDE